jgi:hypothetical protein
VGKTKYLLTVSEALVLDQQKNIGTMLHMLMGKNLRNLMTLMPCAFFYALFAACPLKIQQSINIHAPIAALDSVSEN